MCKQLTLCLMAVLLSSSSAFARFEGVLEMKMNVTSKDAVRRGVGSIRIAVSKAGMRGEINLQMDGATVLQRVVLCRTDRPNINYHIDDVNRTYTEITLSQPSETGGQRQGKDKWSVEKLGQEKVLHYKTQHVLARLKDGSGQSMEMWIATEFLDYETYSRLQAGAGGRRHGEEGLTQALKEVGAEGMPLKVVVTTAEGGKVTMEAVKTIKKSLPPSTFELPAGYTKSVDGMIVTPGATPVP